MKTLLLGSLFILASIANVSAATSNDSLNDCFKKTLESALHTIKADSKENISALNAQIRDCRESVADQIKTERAAKKAATNAKRIERLKSQLAKLQG